MPPLDAATLPDDWVIKPAAAPAPAAGQTSASSSAELPDDWVTAPAVPVAPQSQVQSDIAALGQGAVRGVGSAVSGAGRYLQAGTGPSASRVLAALDLSDQGKNSFAYGALSDAERQQVANYVIGGPDDKLAQRTALQQTIADYDKPNMLTRAGMAIEGAANKMFPVDPANEGIQTGVGRMVGGAGPALALGALRGPGGVLASMVAIGAQTYDSAYQEAIAKGATHAVADDAAGKSALAEAASMVLPVNRVLKLVPVPLRGSLTATLLNLGRHGLEFGTGNALGTFAQNYVAEETYDPGRSLTQGVTDASLEGFISGLVIRGAKTAAGPVRAALQAPSVPGRVAPPIPGVDDVMNAPDVNGAIAAAEAAARAPSGAASSGATAVAPASGESTAPTWGDLFSGRPGDSGGASNVLTMPSGAKVPFTWKVAEGGDLTPASGDLQPRDRDGRVASDAQIMDLANRLDPELLHASPGPDQGAPTVNADGVILSGNGRTRAVRQAYLQGNGDPYRAMVERYGFDTSGMSEPILYRSIDQAMTPEQERQFAVEGNTPSVQRLSGSEQAAIDAHSLTPDLLGLYNPLLTGGPTAAGNREFVRGWVGTLPQSERNAVMDANGLISADGVRRLQGAMLSLGYGDKGTLSRSLESTDDNTRSLTGALADAAPAWAQLQGGITSGRIPPEMSVAPQLIRAVELVRQAREKGQAIGDVLAQGDAFNPIDPVTAGFVQAFYNPATGRASSRTLVADVLRRYAIEAAKTSTDAGLFGDAEPPVAPADILATVVAAARKDAPVLPETGEVAMPSPVTGISQAVSPSRVPSGAVSSGRITTSQVQARDGVGAAENAAGAAPATLPVLSVGGASAPVTRSVGAAASRDMTPQAQVDLSTRDMKANRRRAEMDEILAPPQAGDTMIHVPGSFPTLAERSGDPVVSQYEHLLRERNPGAFVGDGKRLTANNKARVDAYDAITVPDTTLNTMRDDRDARWEAASAGILPSAKPVNLTLAWDWVNGQLNNPRIQETDAIRSVLTDFRQRLVDEQTGKIKTDPAAVWGMHDNLQNQLIKAKDPLNMSGVEKFAKKQITTAKRLVDQAMNVATAGRFQSALEDYGEASKAINAGVLLNDFRPKLTNISGELQAANFHRFVANLAKERGNPGIDPSMDISDETMRSLINIDTDLKRAGLIKLGAAAGSPTNLLGALAESAGLDAAHAVVGKIPIAGPFLEVGQKYLARKRIEADTARHLAPPEGGYRSMSDGP